MTSVLRFFGRSCKSATLVLIAIALLLAVPSPVPADNGNSSQGQGNLRVFRVIDKRGRLVGYSLTENLVAREVNGVWVTFYVQPRGGIFDSGRIYVLYLTSDCTGTRYITHSSTFSEGTRVGPTLYYPVGSLDLSPKSLRVVTEAGEQECAAAPDVPGVYGVATTVQIDSFGLETPFKATQ